MSHTTGSLRLCFVDEAGATWSLFEDEVLVPETPSSVQLLQVICSLRKEIVAVFKSLPAGERVEAMGRYRVHRSSEFAMRTVGLDFGEFNFMGIPCVVRTGPHWQGIKARLCPAVPSLI